MTVSELIEHLKQFHPDLPVYEYVDPCEVRLVEPNGVFKDRVCGSHINREPGISHEAVII